MQKISIISTNLGTNDYLNLNYKLTDKEYLDEWLVVDNYAPKIAEIASTEELNDYFNVVSGIDKTKVQPYMVDGVESNNVQHGLSLNKGLCYINPDYDMRYLVLLDPDFYIIPTWQEIFSFMSQNEFAVYGAVYNSTTPLIKEFPVAFCMIIDREHCGIDVRELDFTPGYGKYVDKDLYPDVGWKVYNYFKYHSNIEYGYAVPGSFGIDYHNPINEKGTKIDEYVWKDNKPFGLHVRGKLNQVRNRSRDRVAHQLKTAKFVINKVRNDNIS